jgi:hypothetical protein
MLAATLGVTLDRSSPISILGARTIARSVRIAAAITKKVISVPIRKTSLRTAPITNVAIIASYTS